MQNIDDKEIPAVSVACPAAFANVSVRDTCTQCRFFCAVANINPDPRLPWAQAHNVLCSFPRRLPVSDFIGPDEALEAIDKKAKTYGNIR
jgi:hypothetical protein